MLFFFEGLDHVRALPLCSYWFAELCSVKYLKPPSFGAGFVVRSVSWPLQLP